MFRDILIAGFILFAGYGLYLMITGKDPDSQLKREIKRLQKKNASRAPIVYLRSFGAEGIHFRDILAAFTGKTIPGATAYFRDAGNIVTGFMSVIGPVVELERPDRGFLLRPLADRPKKIRVDEDRWQDQILEWLPKAALVVIQLDVSDGLAWEISRVVQKVSAKKVVLVLPPTQADYEKVKTGTEHLFPRPLPAKLPEARVMAFKPEWEPWPLELQAGNDGIWRTLGPVFEQNNYEAPDWRTIGGYGPPAGSDKATRAQ